ncbi:glycoside hydrolase family 16 protein [Bacteroides sedimenti]
MKKMLTILISLSCMFMSCSKEPDNSLTPAHILSNYHLAWSDEFDGSSVDLSKWNYRAENTVRNYATVSRNTISMDGKGNVSLKVTKDNSGKYFVGQLGTQGIYETTYGYFECRAKMNAQIGPHVAFWLQSAEMGKVGDPVKNGTEIDVFEYHRKTPGTVYHNLHWDGYGVDHKTTGKQIPVAAIGAGFHTFGLEWTKDAYIFYVDGEETWRSSSAVSQHKEYLILSTELTGWGGDPALGNFPDEVLFDYVRVYKSNY